ncbi:MAG: TonB-dependent receptor, partial [Cytophagales bacterium]|nr:TonB-dependent receptor [Cytophagales bacterium]
TIGNGNAETFIIEPQLSYDQEIGQGRISVLLGGTLQGSDANREAVLASGYQNDALLGDLSAAGSIRSQGTSDNQYRYSAIFTRLNYTWAGKYILNLTGRRDGSSRFGPGQQFGNFGAIGAAWLFSEEKVIANLLPLFSFGKLRASYGVVGNDQIGDYQYLSSYSPVDPYNENQSITPTRAANPEYSWETTRKLEFGLELGFFDDRIRLNSSWYRNRTFDQLIGRPLSATTGYNSQQFNLPATVENRGWEFELTTVNVVSGEFRWRFDFNLSFPENELLEFENIEAFPEFDAFYEVGRPILGRKEFQSLGVNPETGTYDFVDFNRDGVIDVSDRQFFVANVQEFYGGLENSFSYKGLQLDFHLFFVKQEAVDFTVSNFSSSARGGGFVPTTRVLERWQNPGDVTDLPRTSERLGTSNRRNIPNARVDASFIRLQNVSLSWQLPPAWTAAARIENARIYLQGQNLLTIMDYDGWDPETQNTNLPQLRMITTGIQLTF